MAAELSAAIRTGQGDLLAVANHLGLVASRVADLEAGGDGGAAGRYWQVYRYSQLDLRWKNLRYTDVGNASGTFGANGCLVVTFCMLAAIVSGNNFNPPTFSRDLNAAGCFRGNYLVTPSALAVKFPEYANGLTWKQGHRWGEGPADIAFVKAQLARGPFVAGFDFKSNTAAIEPHWVLVLGYVEPSEPGGSDDSLILADPWGGVVRTLDHYWNPAWKPNPTRVSRVLLAAWEFEPMVA